MKFKHFLAFLAFAMGMGSCTNDLVDETTPLMGNCDVITVSMDDADTRTAMNGTNVVWSANDAIGIFTGTINNQYSLKSGEGETSAEFQSAGLVVVSSGTLKEVAYFPYVNTAAWDGSNLTTTLPATYEYAEGTNNNAIMAALMSEDEQSSISFKNAGALYAITVENIPAGYSNAVMTYLGADDKVGIAGAATITFDANGNPTVAVADAADVASAQKTITITFTAADAPTTKTFYFPMPIKGTNGYANKLQFSLQGNGKELITAPVFTKEPERSKLYSATLKLDAVSGGIVTEAVDVPAANDAIKDATSVAVQEVAASDELVIPTKPTESAIVPHTIDLSAAELPEGEVKVTVKTEGEASTETVKEVTVVLPEGTDASKLIIDAPGTTVTIQAVDGTVLDTIEATTADNTLIIGEGVIVENLKITKGNVRLSGNVSNIETSVPATITLDANIILTAPMVFKGTATLDLNGYTISQEKAQDAAYNMIANKGNLTIKSSQAGGAISYADIAELTAAVNYVSNTIHNADGATLTIEDGVSVNNNSAAAIATYGYPHPIDNYGELVINGGTISNNANYSSIRIWCTTDDNTNVTINSGTLNGCIDLHNVNANANKATLTINGGTFNADTYTKSAVRLLGFGADVDELNAVINGGTFNGKIKLNNYVGGTFNSKVFSVVGGTFSDASAFEFLAANANVKVGADMNLEDIAITIPKNSKVELDLNGKTISGVSTSATTSKLIDVAAGAELTLKNGTITYAATTPDTNWGGEGQPAFPGYANNTIKNSGTLLVDNVTIVNKTQRGGASYVIDCYNGSSLTIDGENTLVEQEGGDIAIRMFNASASNAIDVTINNGTVKGHRAVWVQLAGSATAVAPTMNLTVKGGTLESIDESYNQAIYSYSYGNDMKNVNIDVQGGIFNGDIALTGGSNKTNIETLTISNATFNGIDGAYSYGEDAKAAAAITIKSAKFPSLYPMTYMDATDKGNVEITLADNLELTNPVTFPAGSTFTLDLNGKTISQELECAASYSMITNKGDLTIKGNGTISFKDLSNGGGDVWGSYVITNNGNLVIENGTLKHFGSADGDHDTNLPIQNYQGKVTINGGTISSVDFRSLRDYTAGGEIIINGGKFEGQVWMQGLGNGSSSLTINGGEFEPVSGYDGSSVYITNGTNTVNVSITGGTFNTKIGAANAEKDGVKGCITGGTFTESAKSNTNAALLNEGYEFKEGTDGNFTVVAK